jgi:3'-phosphoadenosine 5'-phosphosulfate sulfotransferase (PAPS reductase)/FAD synthetase
MFTVNWSKYPLTQKDWGYFATLDRIGRRKFMKEHGLQYQRKNNVPKCEKCIHVFFHCVCEDPEFAKKKALWQAELNKSFKEKLGHSEELVQKVLEKARKYHLKIYLAYSGGIDSECCLQLFKEGIKEGLITVIVGNTTTELPDTFRRWKEAESELGVKFIYALPERGVTFKSNSIKYGLAIYSRNNGDESKKIPTKQCCGNLKEKPQFKLMKDADGIILGLKATENSQDRKSVV